MEITLLTNDSNGPSYFTEAQLSEDDFNGMVITPRVDALNLRFRRSEPGYLADWHVAGDPTLIVVRQGTLRLGLRDGSTKDFTCGEQFIAQDALDEAIPFGDQHGHTAEVIGDIALLAVHIKLAKRVAT